MSQVTLAAVQAKQTELAAMIQQLLNSAAVTTTIEVEGATIELQPGEHYAGVILDEDGDAEHHLVLMAQRPTGDLTWQAAMDWAESVGGSLPSRQEQALLYANCKPHLECTWHWSSESHTDASYAWYCHFFTGDQSYLRKSCEGSAVAVRRFFNSSVL